MNIEFFDDLNHDIVSINFVIPIGTKTIYKGRKNNFAHLIEHLLFHGHPELSQYGLMLKIEQMGGLVNGETNNYYTELYARVQKRYVIETIKLLHDAVLSFDISLEEYESELEIIYIEEKMKIGNERALLDLVLDELFGKISSNPLPGYDGIKKIYKELYNDWSLILNGKLNDYEKEEIKNLFNGKNYNSIKMPKNLLMRDLLRDHICDYRRLNNRNMFYYVHKCNENTDIIAMKLIKHIYTGGLASILYDKFVAEEEYCYSIQFSEYLINNKFFIISFVYDEAPFDKMKEYIDTVFTNEFICNLGDKQFERAKNMAITEAILKKERISSILNDRIGNFIFQQDITMTEEKLNLLSGMGIGDIRQHILESLF